MSDKPRQPYGFGDATFQAAGGEAGVQRLVDAFYALMSSDERFAELHALHPADIQRSVDRLSAFLCGWMGGPRLYRERFGTISIPQAHEHVAVTVKTHGQWLACMGEAIDAQGYPPEFCAYLKRELARPADVILARANERDRGVAFKPVPFAVTPAKNDR